MATEVVLERPRPGIVVLTLNRDSRMNALSLGLVDELGHALSDLARDPDVSALVITGAGRAFCAGADITEFDRILGPTAVDAVDGVGRYNDLALQLWRLPMPTVAAVNGPAVGGGVALALLCDLRVMAETASLRVNQIERGIVPDMGATFLLPRMVGHAWAADRMLLAKPIPADEATRLGLASGTAATSEELVALALDLADAVTGHAPVAARMTAQAIRAATDGSLADALAREAAAQACCAGTDGFRTSLAHFLESRHD